MKKHIKPSNFLQQLKVVFGCFIIFPTAITIQNNVLCVRTLKPSLYFLFNKYFEVNKKSIERVLTILIFLIFIPLVSFSQNPMAELIVGEKAYLPPLTLEEMVENVKEMNVKNAPKNEIASWLAKVIDWRITNQNSAEFFFDTKTYTGESKLFLEWRDRPIYDHETSAKWAWSNRMGSCEENSNTVYYILKQAGVPKDYRQLYTGKHQFTVWGLAPGADISNPDTWGPNAIVIDPWLGYTVDSDGVKYGKWYLNGDPTIKLTDVTYNCDHDSEEWKTSAEIVLELEGCWNLRTGQYLSQITVYLDSRQGIYDGVLTVNNLENYKNGQLMFSVYRVSESTFRGKEYTFYIDNNGRTIQKEIPMKIAIDSDGNFLTWTSDETVTMQRCN